MSNLILEVPVTPQTFEDAVETMLEWAKTPQHPRYVSTCTVYTLMKARENPLVMRSLQEADMVTTDGMPLVWLQHRAGYSYAQRVYGPDIMLAICDKGRTTGIKHFLWGATPETVAALRHNLEQRFPGLNIVGAGSPGMLDIENLVAQTDVIEQLNANGADIIWVGLGSPKQDVWMHVYRSYLTASLLIAVGAAFDFHSSKKAQAPRWMQRAGIEWLFRLFQEPRRLAPRYLVYNTRFIWELLRLSQIGKIRREGI